MGSQAVERAHAHLESPERQLHPHFHALLSPKALSPAQDGAEATPSEALLGISSSIKIIVSLAEPWIGTLEKSVMLLHLLSISLFAARHLEGQEGAEAERKNRYAMF